MIDSIKCIIRKRKINNISVLFVYNDTNLKKEVVFVFHQLLENKESMLPLAYHLAMHNYFVVLLDLFEHGENINSFEIRQEFNFQNYYECVYKTAKDIEDVYIDIMCTNKEIIVHNSQISCVGVSAGADVALIAGYLYNNIKTVISVIGTLNWNINSKKLSEFKFYSRERRALDHNKITNDIQNYDPLLNYPNLKHLPRLMLLNGVLDTTMPISTVCEAYEKMREIYVNACCQHKIGMIKYKKAGHRLTAEMIKDVAKILKGEK